jgi:O-antigen/teichoic acid export membrane protein
VNSESLKTAQSVELVNHMDPEAPSAFEPARSRSFKRAFFQTFAGSLLIQGCGVVTGILAARLLGTTGRGELAAIFYYPTMLAALGSLGLQQAVAYEVSRRPAEENDILRAGFWTAAALGLLQFALGASLASFLLPKDMGHLTTTLQWFMAFPLLAYSGQVLLGVDQGTFRFARYSFLNSLPLIFYAIGTLIIWMTGTASPSVFAAWALGGHLVALAIRLATSNRVLVGAAPRWTTAVRLLKIGIVLYGPQVTGILVAQADMLFVLYMLPVDQVGLYAVALAIAQGQMAASNAVAQVGFVKVAGETDRAAGVASVLLQFRVAQVIGVVIAAIFIVIAPYLIYYAIGPTFMAAWRAADCLIIALALRGLSNILDHGFRALGHSWVGAFGNAVAFITLAIGAWWWLPQGGIDAMAAVLIVATASTIFTFIFFMVRLEHATLRDFWGFRPGTFRLLKASCGFGNGQ